MRQVIGHLIFVFGNILVVYLGLWEFFLQPIAKCIVIFGHGELTIWIVVLSFLKFFFGEAITFLIFWITNMIVKKYF